MQHALLISEEVLELNEKREPAVRPENHRYWDSPEKADVYGLGVLDGNAAAVRVLVGCMAAIRLVEDSSVPDGYCELRVRSLADVVAPSQYLSLVMPR